MSSQICLAKDCLCIHHPMLDLLKKGENDNAKLLLEYIGNFRVLADNSGLTLLHYAVKYGNMIMVQYLINKGCDINAHDRLGGTPLTTAITSENEKMIELLLKNNADIYEPVHTLKSILSNAVHSVMIRDKQIYQPIMEMISKKLNADFLSDKRDALISLLNCDHSAKLTAVVFGNGELTNFVLDNNYPLEFRESLGGCTALHCAVMYARMENASVLIQRGAFVTAWNNMEYVPFHYYLDHCENADDQFAVLKHLITHLHKPNVHDLGRKNMERLILKGTKRVVKAILETGIDWNKYFKLVARKSLLQMLMSNKDPDVLDVLDELGVEFDANERIPLPRTVTTDDVPMLETTILIRTLKTRCVKKIKFLLEHGANADVTPCNDDVALQTIIYYSTFKEQPRTEAEIIELLLEHGTKSLNYSWNRKHGTDFQVVNATKWNLLRNLNRVNYRSGTNIILAHLALLEVIGFSPLTSTTRHTIQSDRVLKVRYDSCVRQLEEMKTIEVHNNVSLFELLIERKEKKMLAYARDQEFVLAFNSTMRETTLERYYFNILQKQFKKALYMIEWKEKAVLVIRVLKRFTGLCSDVAYIILSYLTLKDLNSISQAEKNVVGADK